MNKQGVIVRWDTQRGYGFVRGTGTDADVFLHARDYQGPLPPPAGQPVAYEEIHVGGKGPRAMAVRPLAAPVQPRTGTAPVPEAPGTQRPQGRQRPSEPQAAASQNHRGTTHRAHDRDRDRDHPARPASRRAEPRQAGPRPASPLHLPMVLLMLVWCGTLAWAMATQRLPWWVAVVALVLNVATYITYASDKQAARQGAWRIPENTLHLLALLGGWPLAWWAQQRLRHKSSKGSFQAMYAMTVLLHWAALVWLFRGGLR